MPLNSNRCNFTFPDCSTVFFTSSPSIYISQPKSAVDAWDNISSHDWKWTIVALFRGFGEQGSVCRMRLSATAYMSEYLVGGWLCVWWMLLRRYGVIGRSLHACSEKYAMIPFRSWWMVWLRCLFWPSRSFCVLAACLLMNPLECLLVAAVLHTLMANMWECPEIRILLGLEFDERLLIRTVKIIHSAWYI